jgi:hypothetical protein
MRARAASRDAYGQPVAASQPAAASAAPQHAGIGLAAGSWVAGAAAAGEGLAERAAQVARRRLLAGPPQLAPPPPPGPLPLPLPPQVAQQQAEQQVARASTLQSAGSAGHSSSGLLRSSVRSSVAHGGAGPASNHSGSTHTSNAALRHTAGPVDSSEIHPAAPEGGALQRGEPRHRAAAAAPSPWEGPPNKPGLQYQQPGRAAAPQQEGIQKQASADWRVPRDQQRPQQRPQQLGPWPGPSAFQGAQQPAWGPDSGAQQHDAAATPQAGPHHAGAQAASEGQQGARVVPMAVPAQPFADLARVASGTSTAPSSGSHPVLSAQPGQPGGGAAAPPPSASPSVAGSSAAGIRASTRLTQWLARAQALQVSGCAGYSWKSHAQCQRPRPH